MLRRFKTLPLALALTAVSLFATSCGSSNSKFRMFNAIPNLTTAVDVLIDGRVVGTVSFGAGTPTSGYLSVSSGTRHVQVFPTGQTTGAYFDGNLSLSSGTPYTFLLAGPTVSLQHALFTDNLTAPTSSSAALRVIAAWSSFQTSADVYLVTAGTGSASGTPLLSGIAYPTASSYQTFPAGSYAFLVTPTGLPGAVDVDVPDATFSGGKIYTYVLIDLPGGGEPSGTPVVLNDN